MSITTADFEAAVAGALTPSAEIRYTKLGDRFLTRDEKAELCGVPLVLVDWEERKSEAGRAYLHIRALIHNPNGSPERVAFTEGGKAIMKALNDFGTTNPNRTLYLENGLRRSEYVIDGEDRVSYHLS